MHLCLPFGYTIAEGKFFEVGVQYLNIDGDNIVDLIDPDNQDVAVLDYNCNIVLHGASTLYIRSANDIQSIINLENDE